MKPRISTISLGVSNLEKSIKFYEEGLGFPRIESRPEIAFFTLNGSWLALFNRDSLAKDASVSPDVGGIQRFHDFS
jgi:catechol 2,3-dioxygenase-like lactoylglutathione lyase family enzyme